MKRVILLFLLAISIHATSQITITNANMPGSNDTIRYSNTSPIGLNYTNTGAGYTWDFSTVTPQSQGLYEYKPSSAISLAYSLFFGFGSYGLKTADTLNLGILTLTDMYDFFQNSSSTFKTVGRGMEYMGLPVPANFSDDDEVYKFPLNYSDYDSSTFNVSFSLATTLELYMKGYRITEVEGWGTVITPFGSFNCLKVKSTIYETDSIVVSGFGTPAIPRVTREYKWLTTTQKIPVFQINGSVLFGNFVPTMARYRDNYSDCLANAPSAAFTASQTTGFVGDSIALNNTSLCATGYFWSITPNTFSYINGTGLTSLSPSVQFSDTGWYAVSLTAINGSGPTTLNQPNYIHIGEFHVQINEPFLESGQVSIFPNPANQQVTINCQKEIQHLELFDLLGRARKMINPKSVGTINLPLDDLEPGIYFLKLTVSGNQEVRKLVIE